MFSFNRSLDGEKKADDERVCTGRTFLWISLISVAARSEDRYIAGHFRPRGRELAKSRRSAATISGALRARILSQCWVLTPPNRTPCARSLRLLQILTKIPPVNIRSSRSRDGRIELAQREDGRINSAARKDLYDLRTAASHNSGRR